MGQPTVGHLDPYYLTLMDDLQSMLRQVFQTQNRLTFAVSATGSAGMEAAVVNVIEPGDAMVVCVNGVFGSRMADVAGRAGAKVTTVERPWGEVFTPDDLRDTLAAVQPKVVGIVMAETSTGAWQPIEEISRLVHDAGALLLVDTVTALGGVPVRVDPWQIDVVYSGSQKCLGCPPGLAPISFNERALDVILHRRTKVQSWYLDVNLLASYWGQDRVYHHTAPINMTYGLYEALKIILEEGLEPCFARHLLNHRALKAGLAALGIPFTAQEGHQLPMLNAVRVPEGVEDARVRRELLGRFGIEIGAGLGAFKGKVWRIGLMGHGSRRQRPAPADGTRTTPGRAGLLVRARRQYRGGERGLRRESVSRRQRPRRCSTSAGNHCWGSVTFLAAGEASSPSSRSGISCSKRLITRSELIPLDRALWFVITRCRNTGCATRRKSPISTAARPCSAARTLAARTSPRAARGPAPRRTHSYTKSGFSPSWIRVERTSRIAKWIACGGAATRRTCCCKSKISAADRTCSSCDSSAAVVASAMRYSAS